MRKIILVPLMLGIVLWASTADSTADMKTSNSNLEATTNSSEVLSEIESYLEGMTPGEQVTMDIVNDDLVIQDYTGTAPEPLAVFPYTPKGIIDAAKYIHHAIMHNGCASYIVVRTANGFDITMIGC